MYRSTPYHSTATAAVAVAVAAAAAAICVTPATLQDVHDHLWSHTAAVWPHPIIQENAHNPRGGLLPCF
jgi:uncharacterized membrane protein YdfJ with MMPL/SSD domain